MSNPTPKRPQLFIESKMPVQLLNQQVYYEHGGNPFKGLHRWYSRKPLSFSRASVLASLLPADVTMPEFEHLLGLVPGKEVKLYKTPPSSTRIKKVQDYCEKTWGTRTPTVLDAFAGGGSIPFEAARYGLNVLASDLNPVAVVTMKAAMEYPLKFGPDLQQDIDKWVQWVGDEAEKRLAEFFPSNPGEKVQNYLWAHTVVCPSCQSVVPLSPNWWLYKRPEKQNLHKWCAVKPIPNPENKRVDFELVKGKKGKGTMIIYNDNSVPVVRASRSLDDSSKDNNSVVRASRSLLVSGNDKNTSDNINEILNNSDILNNSEQDARTTNIENEYDPDTTTTISRGVGRCPNCGNVIDNEIIMQSAKSKQMGYQLYAVAYKQGKGSLEFRIPSELDIDGFNKAEYFISANLETWEQHNILPSEIIPEGKDLDEQIRIFCPTWMDMFNPRQLLTLVTYLEIINEAKALIQAKYEWEKAQAIILYLSLLLDLCVDKNSRLSHWQAGRIGAKRASTEHALNLFWCYPETNGAKELWLSCANAFASDYKNLCALFGTKPGSTGIPGIEQHDPKSIQINSESADNLIHIPNNSVDAVITDPPYYSTIQYAELSDFFYCLAPDSPIITQRGYIPISEITNKDRVLSLDGSWAEVKKVGSRNYNGDIFEIRVAYNNQKLIITQGHKVWILKKENAGEMNGSWVDSSELKKGDYIYMPTYSPNSNFCHKLLKLSDYLDYPHDNYWLYFGSKSSEIIKIKEEIKKLGQKYSTLKEIATYLQVSYSRVVRINNEGDYQKFRIPNLIEIDYDLMKVLGYFLAEGSTLNRRGSRKEGRLTFVFHESEQHYVDDILKIFLEKFQCNGFLQKRNKERAIVLNFYCKPLAELFEKLCGNNSHNKRIPDWVLDAPEQLLKGLLVGYWNGDGSTGNEFFQLTTVSPILACQIRIILQRLGIVSHQHFDNQHRTCDFQNKVVKSQPRFLIKVWGKYREKLAQILECPTPEVKHGNYLNLWTDQVSMDSHS